MSEAKHLFKMKLAPWALLAVAMAWGWAFVIMKDAIERQSVNNFLFTRFLQGFCQAIRDRQQVGLDSK